MIFGEVNLNLGNFLSTVIQIFTRPFVILGLVLYAIGTIFWLTALSKVELSFAYPMLSLGYVLILFLSWILLGEKVSLIRFSGIALICLGLFLIVKTWVGGQVASSFHRRGEYMDAVMQALEAISKANRFNSRFSYFQRVKWWKSRLLYPFLTRKKPFNRY